MAGLAVSTIAKRFNDVIPNPRNWTQYLTWAPWMTEFVGDHFQWYSVNVRSTASRTTLWECVLERIEEVLDERTKKTQKSFVLQISLPCQHCCGRFVLQYKNGAYWRHGCISTPLPLWDGPSGMQVQPNIMIVSKMCQILIRLPLANEVIAVFLCIFFLHHISCKYHGRQNSLFERMHSLRM